MLTPENIRKVNFMEGNNQITLIYNKTQISDEMVSRAIGWGMWKLDPRLIEVDPNQLNYLTDKVEENRDTI